MCVVVQSEIEFTFFSFFFFFIKIKIKILSQLEQACVDIYLGKRKTKHLQSAYNLQYYITNIQRVELLGKYRYSSELDSRFLSDTQNGFVFIFRYPGARSFLFEGKFIYAMR